MDSMVGPLGVPGLPGTVGGSNLGVLLTAAQMHDPTGSSSRVSPTTGAQEQNELKLVRLRLRQAPSDPRSRTRSPSPVAGNARAPVAVDLVCREKLTPEREQTGPTGSASRKRGLDAPTGGAGTLRCPKNGDPFRPEDTDLHYWEKHKVLMTMLNGFTGVLVKRVKEANIERANPLMLCRVADETKATQPPGALKTQKDLEVLDQQIFQVCQAHTKLVTNQLKRHKEARARAAAAAQSPAA